MTRQQGVKHRIPRLSLTPWCLKRGVVTWSVSAILLITSLSDEYHGNSVIQGIDNADTRPAVRRAGFFVEVKSCVATPLSSARARSYPLPSILMTLYILTRALARTT